MKILVTGAAGFIGFHTSLRLLDRGDEVVGIDNLNNYYDVRLKEDRLAILSDKANFKFIKMNIADRAVMEELFPRETPKRVVHLAAQAGVRHSLTHPHDYIDSNIVGFMNVLEGCRYNNVEHLVYASSSSVYGANTKFPFSVEDNVDHPVSLYAASKKANELMAHSYSHLYRLPTTGLRFFTVYGSWGRPDMAYFIFTKSIIEGQPIDVYNYGKMKRDFTYIDDIVEGIVHTLDKTAAPDPDWSGNNPVIASSSAPYKVYNIGNHSPVDLLYFIEVIEKCLGKKAIINLKPMQPGDVPETFADVSALMREVGFKPDTSIETGVGNFVEWYLKYFSRSI